MNVIRHDYPGGKFVECPLPFGSDNSLHNQPRNPWLAQPEGTRTIAMQGSIRTHERVPRRRIWSS